MAVRLVVFDCDGTLVDSEGGIVASMHEALARLGLPIRPTVAVRRVVGLSLLEAAARLLPEASAEEHAALVEAYRNAHRRLRTRPGFDQALFPGTVGCLDELRRRGVYLGIATGKSQAGLATTLDLHGLHDRFDTLQTADDAPSKPHPGMLLRAMDAVGCAPEETLFVGDTSFDMEAARNAGTTGIGVAWGYHPPDELEAAGAAAVVQDHSQLLEWMDRS
jgi:phosphoglycolate phosphatase